MGYELQLRNSTQKKYIIIFIIITHTCKAASVSAPLLTEEGPLESKAKTELCQTV